MLEFTHHLVEHGHRHFHSRFQYGRFTRGPRVSVTASGFLENVCSDVISEGHGAVLCSVSRAPPSVPISSRLWGTDSHWGPLSLLPRLGAAWGLLSLKLKNCLIVFYTLCS